MTRHPVALPLITDPDHAPALRRLDCARYGACLDDAERAGWRGFGCGDCGGYVQMAPADLARDRERLVELLAAVFRSGSPVDPGARTLFVRRVSVRLIPPVVVVCKCGRPKHPRARQCDPCRYAVARVA